MRWIVMGLLLLLLLPDCGAGREIHVGTDADAPTIAAAIGLARPGDTIHLAAGQVYYEVARFHRVRGEPDRPITLDGHGATLDGSDPLDADRWREVSPGLFAAADLLPSFDQAMLTRWYFLFDGAIQRMDRASKGTSAPLKAPADLRPGEWTFVEDPARRQPPSQRIFGTFYLRLAAGQTLAGARIRVPVRSAGVQLSGDNAHLVIRNVTATHVYNDGFNIHGDCRAVRFENIRAIECGDDGISAHESAQYHVDGLVSLGNSTGICDIGQAQTSYRNVFIADCAAVDLFFLDSGRFRLTNAVVYSSAQHPLRVTGRTEGDCRLVMENVLIRRLVEPRLGQIAPRASVQGTDCTFEGMELNVTGMATWHNCLIGGQPTSPGASGADRAQLLPLVPPDRR